MVANTTRVVPGRLHARRASGGAVELLLLEELPGGDWEALARPSRRLREGEILLVGASSPSSWSSSSARAAGACACRSAAPR